MDKGTGLLRPVILFFALVLFSEGRVVKVPVGPLVHVEGQAVSIRCNVSNYEGPREQDFDWSILQAGGTVLNLISTLGGFIMDSSVRDRVNSGDISYEKLTDNSVELRFKKVRATDSGVYRCGTPSTDSVISGNYHADVELKVIGDSLKVSPAIPKSAVSEGEPLELQCNATRGFTEHTFLSVSWSLRRGDTGPLEDILTFGPDDKISVGSNYTQRYTDGGLRLDLRGGGFYGLVLKRTKPSDQGQYVCAAQEWVRQGEEGRRWRKILEKSEDMGKVVVTPTDLQFKVTLTASVNPQASNDPAELLCQVLDLLHLQDGRLAVTWSYSTITPGDVSQKKIAIASLNEEGALIPGSEYKPRLDSGDIAVSRRESNVFVLRLLQTRDADMGSYSCAVNAWMPTRQAGWEKAKEVQSTPVSVQWTPQIPVLRVVAHRVREASTGGSTFEMTCQVTGQNLRNPGYTVLIRFEETLGGKSRKVLSLSQDSVLQSEEWSEPSRVDSVVLEKTGQLEYRFRLYGVQVTDRGFYYCDVTAWTRDQKQEWIKSVSAESNKIEIAFVHTGPVFNISIHSEANNVLPGDTVQMKCIISILNASPNTGDVAFDVRWFQDSGWAVDNGGVSLVSMDHWGVVKKSSNHSSLERTDRHTFVLSLHKTQDRDAGEYHCRATPWLLSPATGAWSRGEELTSTSTFLSVQMQLWESLKMPVGYGVFAAVIAGVLSVLLGLLVAHCCFSRNPMHTPRPRNKLMDLEMD
ncbi:prostaglandin F2 receptor negative regulator [Pimephales promelas]|uniref:prostaglandin F2 receptor negative regulator n=1 Tax=Pimephales promelas TaxID=90988 RepID=UPI001955742E|nr:prostaglandin F2 receptor negative regulator [Pimephales promelas]KAG1932788.1 immunoglobulin superfamily [Pimephales promelas]